MVSFKALAAVVLLSAAAATPAFAQDRAQCPRCEPQLPGVTTAPGSFSRGIPNLAIFSAIGTPNLTIRFSSAVGTPNLAIHVRAVASIIIRCNPARIIIRCSRAGKSGNAA